METEAANRRYDALHKDKPYHDGTFKSWADSPTDAAGRLTHPYHFRDGVTIWVATSDLTPADKFLTSARSLAAEDDLLTVANASGNPRGGD